MKKRGTVNGWTIVHVAGVEATGEPGTPAYVATSVQFETQDARINERRFATVNSLRMAEVNWIYAVQFKNSVVVNAVELQRL